MVNEPLTFRKVNRIGSKTYVDDISMELIILLGRTHVSRIGGGMLTTGLGCPPGQQLGFR